MREVARGVADRLGFAYIDEQIVTGAAERAGVEPIAISDAERRRSFLERVLDRVAATPEVTALQLSGGGAVYHAPGAEASGALRGLIRTAIEETAARGEAVIVAHAASHALASDPGVLRVLVTASPGVRAARVSELEGLSEKETVDALERSDEGRSEYLECFHGIESELPTHYDLVLNTDRLSTDAAVALVALAADS
jgi:hypothetical protein